ncbi:MAG: PASTA domain-containing protein [Flavobacteriales bacterium]|nr:PASTA domain-containing protein [Flavobacteriales bacterium]
MQRPKFLNFYLFLQNPDGSPVSTLSLIVQFYNTSRKIWMPLATVNLNNGEMFLENIPFSKVQSRAALLSMLTEDVIPEFRVVPSKPIYNTPKEEVIALMFSFDYDEKKGILSIDFGRLTLVPKELAIRNFSDKNFILIASLFPLTGVHADAQSTVINLEKKLKELNEELEKVKTKNEKLEKNLEEHKNKLILANNSISQINQEKKDLLNELKECSKIIKEKESLIADFKKQLEELTKYIDENLKLNLEIQKLTDENERLNTIIESKNNELINLKEEYTKLNADYGENKAKIEELERRLLNEVSIIANLENQIAMKDQIIASQLEKINQLEERDNAFRLTFEEQTNKINQLQSEKLAEINLRENVENQLRQAINDIKNLQNQLDLLTKEVEIIDKPISFDKLIDDVSKNLTSFEVANTSGYQVRNLELNVKGVVASTSSGVSLQLLNPNQIGEISPYTVSEIKLTIDKKPVSTITEELLVPNLLGFTESAVRKILDNHNLKLQAIYQRNVTIPSGQSFKQHPEAGTKVNENDYVTVIFSKNE